MFEVGVHESSNEGRQKFLPKDLIGMPTLTPQTTPM